MLVGHYGVALGAKAADRRIPLWLLVLVSNLPDVVWSVLLMAGVELSVVDPGATKWVPLKAVYSPFSHSILGVCVQAVLLGLCMYIAGRCRRQGFPDLKASLVAAGVVLAHIIIDIPVHVPDLPLAGWNSPKLGLGLWNYPLASNALELGLMAAGLWLYFRAVRGLGIKKAPVLVFAGMLVVYHFINGLVPPPANLTPFVLGLSYLACIIAFSAAGFWIERKLVVGSK